jgi:hypothetical protein
MNNATNNQYKKLPTACGTSSLERPQFNPGQLLDDDDLNAGVNYTRELTRLLFRSLFGCGVICGLKVSWDWACQKTQITITVTKGLALDCLGNLIELPKDVTMTFDPDCKPLPPAVWVTVCYVEKCCRPKDVTCSQNDDSQPKPTRVRSGWEVKVYTKLPKCACHCVTTDDTPPPQTATPCGGQTQPAPAGQTPPAGLMETTLTGTQQPPPVTVCECYRPHFEGECDCGCNCSCVIVGKINIPAPTDQQTKPDPDTSMVRRIRPLLNGYIDCGSIALVDRNRSRRIANLEEADEEAIEMEYEEYEIEVGSEERAEAGEAEADLEAGAAGAAAYEGPPEVEHL